MNEKRQVHMIDPGNLAASLRSVADDVNNLQGGELIVDMRAVSRVDPHSMGILNEIARTAEENQIGITIRGANINLYRVFKLTKLSYRFNFED